MISGNEVAVSFKWLRDRGYCAPQFGRVESSWILTIPPTSEDFVEWTKAVCIIAQAGAFKNKEDANGHAVAGVSFSGGFTG